MQNIQFEKYSQYLEWDKNGNLALPNIKKIFIPDNGMELFDGDLSGADAMVYGTDSNCKALLDFFDNPKKFHPSGKLYAWIASEHQQRLINPEDEEYKPYKASHHGVWYGMAILKLALTIGVSETFAQELMKFYNYIYPEKEKWHKRLLTDVKNKGFVTNAFGRRLYFLNRNNPTFTNEVFASIPQSTIGDVINRAWVKCRRELSRLRPILMQTHDSLTGQYPIEVAEEYRERIPKLMEIPVPYDPPLYIPADIKVSTVSYGDTKKVK